MGCYPRMWPSGTGTSPSIEPEHAPPKQQVSIVGPQGKSLPMNYW